MLIDKNLAESIVEAVNNELFGDNGEYKKLKTVELGSFRSR